MKANPKWKLFEKDIHAIHSMFRTQGSTVTHNDLIYGVDSKVDRQVDVSIRTTVETYQILIAIECKNKKRPIDVAEVGQFSTLARDVRANKGVMISTSGFTSAAITWAAAHGLDLIKFDTTEGDSIGLRSIPILCIQNQASWAAEIGLLSHRELTGKFSASHHVELFSESGESQGTLAHFVELSGREGRISMEPGEVLLTSSHNLFIKIGGLMVKADVRARIRMERHFFFLLAPFKELLMSDVVSGTVVRRLVTTDFVHLRPWDAEGKASGWREIQSEAELSVVPALTITNNPWT